MNAKKYMTGFVLLGIICGVGYGFTNSVYSGTYVDAGDTNTVRADSGGTWYSTDATTARTNNWWRWRGYANSGSVYEADATGAENAPILKTTTSGYPYMYYDVYAVYWCSDGVEWLIRAGVKSDSLTLFGKGVSSFSGATAYSGATAGKWTGAHDGDRAENEAYLGVTVADATGKVSIFVDDTTADATNNRSWYDGMEYKVVNIPFNPSPANAAVSVATTTTTVSFTSMRDPNAMTSESPIIVSHKVYFDDDPNLADAGDLIATVAKGTSQATIPGGVSADKKYYWRIDEVLSDSSVVTGVVWTFETVKTTPDFNPPIGSQPQNTSAYVNGNAVMTVSAGVGSYTYQWYKGTSGVVSNPVSNQTGHISGAGTGQLTITAQAADEGYYWCRATNLQGSADSTAALVVVKRPVAHWTLDAVTSGQYVDSSGENHNADVTGSPVPVTGMIGDAIPFNGTSTGCANSGTWNPSQYSGQISVSLWARWSGQTDTASWQGLVSKEVSFAADQMMWQLEIDQANNNLVFKNGSSVSVTATPMVIGQWEHIVITFDGATGRIYRNGSSVASGGFSLSSKTDAPMNIGASANATGTYNFIFNGTMDDVRVYNYAMDGYEVAMLYTDVVPTAMICITNPAMDLSGPAGVKDCKVNFYDFAEIAKQWLQCNLVPSSSCN